MLMPCSIVIVILVVKALIKWKSTLFTTSLQQQLQPSDMVMDCVRFGVLDIRTSSSCSDTIMSGLVLMLVGVVAIHEGGLARESFPRALL